MKTQNEDAMLIGVDWGGAKIEGVAMASSGLELLRLREGTPRHDNAACLRAIARAKHGDASEGRRAAWLWREE